MTDKFSVSPFIYNYYALMTQFSTLEIRLSKSWVNIFAEEFIKYNCKNTRVHIGNWNLILLCFYMCVLLAFKKKKIEK